VNGRYVGRSSDGDDVVGQVVMTKRKDDEETSSTLYNAMDHRDPVLDFQKYVDDDENITDQVRDTQHNAHTQLRSSMHKVAKMVT